MKSNTIIRIILFSLAIIILLGILISGIFLNLFVFIKDEHHETVHNPPIAYDKYETRTAVDAEKIQNIEIDWVSGSITIEKDETCADIVVAETGTSNEEYQMICTTIGNTLKIQYCKDGITFPSFGITINGSVNKDLIIKVPGDWSCHSLEIDTASAWVQLSGLTIDEFDFDGASGKCTISNCYLDTLDLDTASGDVQFEGTLNHLDCDAASANCRLTVYNSPNSIKLDSASGNLELRLPEDCGFTCSMETLSGRFSSDLETVHKNGRYIHGDGACKIHVNAMSGDVTISKAEFAPMPTIPYCTDPNCTNSNHDHTAVCTDESCTNPNHGHRNHH